MNRRSFIGAAAILPAAAAQACPREAPVRVGRPVVMIHGAWHGGWCWSRLAPLLSHAGHPVSAPTLTGLGERRQLLSRTVTLDTHIQDLIQHIEAEELFDVTLLAHSYGGFVATGAADALGERIAAVILLDAFAPKHGEAVLDYAGAERKNAVIAAAERNAEFSLAPMAAAALGITCPDDIAWVERRMTPQPVGTYIQPIRLSRGLDAVARKVYLACDQARLTVFDTTKERIRSDATWRYAGLPTGHDAMVIAPNLLAEAVLKAVDQA